MIPISLSLKNFMSYGTEAPKLDFRPIHTACLSGNNGQGKSALLDAITWALWGKARRVSNQNPAKTLLRIGADEMKVEFEFNLDQDRYRVLRTYYGTKAKSHLELHGRKQSDERYRPYSSTSIRNTQREIDRVIGLDYDTFTSSALLLQGKGEEFTRGTPSERKQVLAKILNLGRYEDLRKAASEKRKDEDQNAKQAEAEVQQLMALVADAGKWEAEQSKLQSHIEETENKLTAARDRTAEVRERILHLKSLRNRKVRLDGEVKKAERQLRRLSADIVATQADIQSAQRLLVRADEIKRNHARMVALQKERQDLDDQREVRLGLERQRIGLQKRLNDERHKVELRLKTLENKRNAAISDLKLVEEAQRDLPGLQRRLQVAIRAAREEKTLRATASRLEKLKRRVRDVKHHIETQRKVLEASIGEQQRRARRLRHQLRVTVGVLDDKRALETKAAGFEACAGLVEEITAEGSRVADAISALKGQIEGYAGQRQKLQRQIAFLSSDATGACPTCGTDLTPDHRMQVQRELQEELATLDAKARNDRQEQGRLQKQRKELRNRWSRENQQLKAIKTAQVKLAQVTERSLQVERDRASLQSTEAKRIALVQRLDQGEFAQGERALLTQLKDEVAGIPFNEGAFERCQKMAAERTVLKDAVTATKNRIATRERHEGKVAECDEGIRALRRQLDGGSPFRELQARIRDLSTQMDDVGYDGARLHKVKQELKRLGKASEELTLLTSAYGDRDVLSARLEVLRQDRLQAVSDQGARRDEVRKIQARLSDIGDRENELRECQRIAQALEEKQKTLQLRLGELTEKLATAAERRTRMKERRRAQRRHKRDMRHYELLVRAFGKKGIPSLIIEETLPEIMRRTSNLLRELSNGQMELRIDTTRDGTQGKAIDTLELKVRGEQGKFRAYETFSGGEAFRINFALRVALAQLLASRHGVRMRMLVIDEGFGTQDPAGIRNLVDAISSVQKEFDKILVITHLPEVKNEFPVRIEVRKDPYLGSSFRVMGT